MLDLTQLPYIQAAPNTYREASGRQVQQIVVHTAEAPKRTGVARAVAMYFHNCSDGRPASAHYMVDVQEIYHCVQNKDIAYAAPGANANGIHIEHAGYASQTPEDWADAYNQQMLSLSAELAATLCSLFDIPAQWLSPSQVAAHEKGITSHWNVTKAYPSLHGTHTDPGPNFPIEDYIAMVVAQLRSNAEDTDPANRTMDGDGSNGNT